MTCNCSEPGEGILTTFGAWAPHTYDATPTALGAVTADAGGSGGMPIVAEEMPLPGLSEVAEPTYLEGAMSWLGGVGSTLGSMADTATRTAAWLDWMPWVLVGLIALCVLMIFRTRAPRTVINNPTYNSPRYRGPFPKQKH